MNLLSLSQLNTTEKYRAVKQDLGGYYFTPAKSGYDWVNNNNKYSNERIMGFIEESDFNIIPPDPSAELVAEYLKQNKVLHDDAITSQIIYDYSVWLNKNGKLKG